MLGTQPATRFHPSNPLHPQTYKEHAYKNATKILREKEGSSSTGAALLGFFVAVDGGADEVEVMGLEGIVELREEASP